MPQGVYKRTKRNTVNVGRPKKNPDVIKARQIGDFLVKLVEIGLSLDDALALIYLVRE